MPDTSALAGDCIHVLSLYNRKLDMFCIANMLLLWPSSHSVLASRDIMALLTLYLYRRRSMYTVGGAK